MTDRAAGPRDLTTSAETPNEVRQDISQLGSPGIYGATARLIDEAQRVIDARADLGERLPHLTRATETARRELASLRFRPVRSPSGEATAPTMRDESAFGMSGDAERALVAIFERTARANVFACTPRDGALIVDAAIATEWADEIVRLRAQLAAAPSVAAPLREPHWLDDRRGCSVHGMTGSDTSCEACYPAPGAGSDPDQRVRPESATVTIPRRELEALQRTEALAIRLLNEPAFKASLAYWRLCMTEISRCQLCGEPMPAGEEMFNYHGYSGPCPVAMNPPDAIAERTDVDLLEPSIREELLALRDFARAPLNDLARQVHAANAKWWYQADGVTPLKRNKGELLMLVVTEVAEAMEGERKDLMDDKLPHRRMAEVEIVDAIVRLLDYAAAYGYDLDGAMREKMAFNASREDHKREAAKIAAGEQF